MADGAVVSDGGALDFSQRYRDETDSHWRALHASQSQPPPMPDEFAADMPQAERDRRWTQWWLRVTDTGA